MGFLDNTGVGALWSKVKANFATTITVDNATVSIKNAADTPQILSQVTIPDATSSTPGVMSAAMFNKLETMPEKVSDLTNDAKYQTEDEVTQAIASAISGASAFQSTITANSAIESADYRKGMYWVVNAAGTYVGEPCEVGDMVFCIATKDGAYKASDFTVVQNNIQAITTAELNSILV